MKIKLWRFRVAGLLFKWALASLPPGRVKNELTDLFQTFSARVEHEVRVMRLLSTGDSE